MYCTSIASQASVVRWRQTGWSAGPAVTAVSLFALFWLIKANEGCDVFRVPTKNGVITDVFFMHLLPLLTNGQIHTEMNIWTNIATIH